MGCSDTVSKIPDPRCRTRKPITSYNVYGDFFDFFLSQNDVSSSIGVWPQVYVFRIHARSSCQIVMCCRFAASGGIFFIIIILLLYTNNIIRLVAKPGPSAPVYRGRHPASIISAPRLNADIILKPIIRPFRKIDPP